MRDEPPVAAPADARKRPGRQLTRKAAAPARTESRGLHFRTDFSGRDDGRFQKHSGQNRTAMEGRVLFETW
ncbi:MAG TPA: hypothetical protein VND90_09425 [Terracidiphilus sp.]|nr:hypothetical protein [Terracidiphilus sp.]